MRQSQAMSGTSEGHLREASRRQLAIKVCSSGTMGWRNSPGGVEGTDRNGQRALEKAVFPGGLIGTSVNLSLSLFFCHFRAASAAYGGTQARGRIMAPAADHTATATWDLSLICDLHYSSQEHQILNSLSKARDRTCVLMDTS